MPVQPTMAGYMARLPREARPTFLLVKMEDNDNLGEN